MAHTIGTIPARSAATTANPITVSQEVLSGETVFVLMLKVVGATNRAGGAPTWGDDTFTQANTTQKAATSPEASCELWYLLNPLPGTATLTIPNTGALSIYYQVAMARAVSGGHSAFDGANGGNATSTNPTPGAVVTTQDGDVLFAITAGGWTNVSSATPAQTLISTNDDGAHGCGTQYALQATKGSITLNWTFGTSDDWGAVVAAFKEIAPHNIANLMYPQSSGLCVAMERRR